MKFKTDAEKQNFHDLVQEAHEWPCEYLFKFIVPTGQVTILKALFHEEVKFELKPSSGGKYTSITVLMTLKDAKEVIEIYERVSEIQGLLAL